MSEGEFWRCECGATSLADADAMPTRRRDIDGVAHRTANGGGCNVPVADRDATIARLTAEIDAMTDALNFWMESHRRVSADLAALRARVEAAVEHITGRKFDLGSVTWISDYMEDLLAILAPPGGPTDKGETP